MYLHSLTVEKHPLATPEVLQWGKTLPPVRRRSEKKMDGLIHEQVPLARKRPGKHSYLLNFISSISPLGTIFELFGLVSSKQ